MMHSTPSALYRLGQVLRVLAILALIFLVLFLVTVAASAALLGEGVARQAKALDHSDSASITGTTVRVNVSFLLSNLGYYNIGGLKLAADFTNETIQPGLLARATGGPINIPGHGAANVTLLTAFDMDTPAGPFLLEHDADLPGTLWLNASYAAIIPVNLALGFTYHWDAPFEHLNYSVGTPTAQLNGTFAIPVAIHFDDHTTGLTLAGDLSVTVHASGGAVCATQTIPVETTGGPVALKTTFYSSQSCSTSGGTITSVYTAPGIDLPLPTQAIP
jgi:hypothetical protein